MAVVGNFYFFVFLRLTWKFVDFESERGGSVYWRNNKIIDMCKEVQKIFLKTFRIEDTRLCEARKKVMRMINLQIVLVSIRDAGVSKESKIPCLFLCQE